MALVDDQMAVVGHAIINDTLSDETLNDGDVEQPGGSASPAADATDRLRRHVEERRESLDPLVQQLTPMHEHERADAALGDQPGGDHRLAKRRRGRQHAGLVRQHRVCRRLLLGPEFAVKGHVERAAGVALVANDRCDTQIAQGLANLVEAPSRQADVMRMILSAGDDARLVVRGQPHRLRLVELGILKGRQAKQPVSETRMQPVLGDVDLIAEHQLHRLRQFSDDRRLLAVTRWRGCPRLIVAVVLWRQPHAEDATTPFRLLRDLLDLGSAHLAHAREKRPLICPRHERVIEEDAVALLAGSLLQRQGDQVAESSLRHRVLIRKETVVRIQSDVRPPLHRLGQEVRSEPAGQRGRNRLLEEDPDVSASSGARPFERGG